MVIPYNRHDRNQVWLSATTNDETPLVAMHQPEFLITHMAVRGTELNNSTNMAQDFSSYSRRIKGSILKYASFDATQNTS